MTDNLPGVGRPCSVNRPQTECPINIARRSGAKVRGRPAGGFWLTPSRGVEIADRQFRLPRDGKRKKQFLHTFVCLQKYVACLASGRKMLPTHRQPNLHTPAARFGRGARIGAVTGGEFRASRETPTESAVRRFLLGRQTCMRVCGAITFRTITHGCRAAVPFGLSPKRHQKRFFPLSGGLDE